MLVNKFFLPPDIDAVLIISSMLIIIYAINGERVARKIVTPQYDTGVISKKRMYYNIFAHVNTLIKLVKII